MLFRSFIAKTKISYNIKFAKIIETPREKVDKYKNERTPKKFKFMVITNNDTNGNKKIIKRVVKRIIKKPANTGDILDKDFDL